MRYFISGHGDLTEAEFAAHYAPQIDKALYDPDARFVVGDFKGADTLAQNYLVSRVDSRLKVTVFHMFDSPRYCIFRSTFSDFTSDEERDAAMTAYSDVDIAWVRPGREKSGTAKNILRRQTNKNDK